MSDTLSKIQALDSQYEKASAEGSRMDLPPGKYTACVGGGEVFESKEERLYLRLNLTVSEGDMKGVVFSKLYQIDVPERLPWLKKDMFTMGILCQKLSDLPAQIQGVAGMDVIVEVKQNGKFTNYYINGKAATKAASEDVPF